MPIYKEIAGLFNSKKYCQDPNNTSKHVSVRPKVVVADIQNVCRIFDLPMLSEPHCRVVINQLVHDNYKCTAMTRDVLHSAVVKYLDFIDGFNIK